MATNTSRATLDETKSTYKQCNHGTTDDDKTLLATLWPYLTAGVAAYNTGQAISFALKQYEIAKLYYKISKWWLDYYNSYFAPVEDQELAEAMALKEVTPYYDSAIGKSQIAAHLRFKNAANKAVQCTSEYCTGLRALLLRDTLAQEATSAAALAMMGYRNERAYYESRSDVRWKRMLATASRGRDLQASAVNTAQLSLGIYGDLGTQAGKAAQGAASLAGYYWNRNDTVYPTLLRGSGTSTTTTQTNAPDDPVTTSGAMRDSNGRLVAVPPGTQGFN